MHVLLLTALAAAEPADLVTVHPQDTGAALCNPGMGWVLHFYDNVPSNYGSRLAPSDTIDDFPGFECVYLRIPWSYVEPEEGRFNWAVVDTPAQRWLARGKEIAFRFSCSESWMRYATPEWVQRAGAKGHNFKPGEGVTDDGPFWEPDYDDPVFLDKLDHFLAAAAARYDGRPDVAFVDVGSFGVWGEGHTYSSTRLSYSADTVKRHIDLHLKHFQHTLLAANDDFVSQDRGDEGIDYAREHGLTLRDDSILVQGGKNAYFHAEMAQSFWPTVPVILESEHYGGSKARGNWQDGSLYLQAVEEYHASYASIHWWPQEFLDECRPLIDQINQRLGYRLQLVEASWPRQLGLLARFSVTLRWRNAGVAPCYRGGHPALTLKDDQGGIVGVFADPAFDVKTLPVAAPGEAQAVDKTAELELPFNLPGGRYDVYVSVGDLLGCPVYELPLPDGDGERRYKLGSIEVTGDYGVSAGALERHGAGWLLPLHWTVHRALPATAVPFCHFERDGRLSFQATADPQGDLTTLHRPGEADLGCILTVPDEAKGQTFEVLVGLWQPEVQRMPDERLLPDRDDGVRRTRVGLLRVSADGLPTLDLPAP